MAALIAFSFFSIGAFTAEPTRLEKWAETHNYDNEISIKTYFYFDNFLISFMNPVIHYKNGQQQNVSFYFDGGNLKYLGSEYNFDGRKANIYFEVLSLNVDDEVFEMLSFSIDVSHVINILLNLGIL